jgi:hypothetical protein
MVTMTGGIPFDWTTYRLFKLAERLTGWHGTDERLRAENIPTWPRRARAVLAIGNAVNYLSMRILHHRADRLLRERGWA